MLILIFIIFDFLDSRNSFDFGSDDIDLADVIPSQPVVRPSLGTIFPISQPFPKRARTSGNTFDFDLLVFFFILCWLNLFDYLSFRVSIVCMIYILFISFLFDCNFVFLCFRDSLRVVCSECVAVRRFEGVFAWQPDSF